MSYWEIRDTESVQSCIHLNVSVYLKCVRKYIMFLYVNLSHVYNLLLFLHFNLNDPV